MTPPVQNPLSLKTTEEILAFAEFQKQRADDAEKRADKWEANAASWESLYKEEKTRSETYKSSGQDRKDANAETNIAVTLLREQTKDDKDYIKQLGNELKACHADKWKYLLGGAAGGYGAGKFGR